MSRSTPLDTYREQARLHRVLASPARLMLLDILAHGEATVTQLARQAGLTMTAASRHLSVLKTEGLVESRKDGNEVHYRLHKPHA